ncbi:MAG: DUF6737 family protein [Cyanobacteriota bacterium]|nr:DUF6737 family protein [Cyanobacteriota bacterium]
MLNLPENPADFSPWHYKPRWCQPWSILLTGALGIVGSWFLFHRLWLTLPLGLLIGVWWLYFLILWPRLLKQELYGTDYPEKTKLR